MNELISNKENKKANGKEFLTGVVLGILLLLGVVFLVLISGKTNENATTTAASSDVFDCPYCHDTARFQPCKNNLWIIECDNEECGYKTVRFETKKAAADWWNEVYGE